MRFTSLRWLGEKKLSNIGQSYVQCQMIKQLEIHSSKVTHYSILIVNILTDFQNSICLTDGILSESAACGVSHYLESCQAPVFSPSFSILLNRKCIFTVISLWNNGQEKNNICLLVLVEDSLVYKKIS